MEPKTTSADNRQGNSLSYVLITPARNEAAFIEQVIESVIAQDILPLKWVIVSDGSTDGTDEIVKRYAANHPWIELVRTPERKERHFAGKVMAFNAGYDRVRNMAFDIIGNLDADITFEDAYFSFILNRFAEDPSLGVAGTPFREGSHQYDYRFTNISHVSGACQLFRRDCFQSIGGYQPMKGGGIDLVAVMTARMYGWKTRSFTEMYCVHHRKMGTAKVGTLRSRFNDGEKDYTFGAHPLWEVFRTLYQMTNTPLFLGGFALFLGYVSRALGHTQRPVSKGFVDFRRKEEMQRLRLVLTGDRHV